jgi:hypothetical protein
LIKIFLLLLLNYSLYADLLEPIHSSLSTYIEDKDYKDSKQKDSGNVYGVGADIHYKASEYKITYEYGGANTKKPPMKDDLKFQKLYTRYAYTLQNGISFHINYLSILDDNIAITDGGDIYGLGLSSLVLKKILANFSYYHSDYDDFKTDQFDMLLEYKMAYNGVKMKFSTLFTDIELNDKNKNSFTKNAKESYFTAALKLHTHYKSYQYKIPM